MYKIVNQAGQNTEILLYSLIIDGVSASNLIEQLQNMPDNQITLRINSDGGSIFEALAIYNYLKDKNVHAIIDGVCASAATIVAMSAKKITMKPKSMFMIHSAKGTFSGINTLTADELRVMADVLDKLTGTVTDIYSQKTGLSSEVLAEMMAKVTWMTPQEALETGFIDEIEAEVDPESERESESEVDKVPEAPENPVTMSASYEDGIMYERARMQALDELNAPGREKFINEAKYKTFMCAKDVAFEILKHEKSARVENSAGINNLPLPDDTQSAIDSMVSKINSWR